ncbi:hypothetical protein E4U28_008471 [Claviceps purpurea]|nr:hypothetical protein E4U28_008471 [Claviceps purpurea]
MGEYELKSSMLLNQLFAKVSNNRDEQGAWSQWWSRFHANDPSTTPIMQNAGQFLEEVTNASQNS